MGILDIIVFFGFIAAVLAVGMVKSRGVGGGEEVLRREAELESALSGAAEDVVVAGEGLMHPCWQGFFHADRRASAADIAGLRQEFADVNHLDFFVACYFCRLLEVHFVGARNNAYEEACFVASKHECLENLFNRFPKHLGCMFGAKVVLVHLVGDEFVADMELVQQPRCVGFFRFLCHSF